ncbi:MAG: TM2 domain-containing protein [Prevotellaceae bacterium]|jgi:TM2 domain-containing membrane protein YozV|nr:TM2 domain-containing protein [Prevotellaceae bacterium]
MYCNNCGNEVSENAAVCLKCGASVKSDANAAINDSEAKDWLTTLLLCFFLGYLGIHSFYTKKTGVGVAQLLTAGGCGIWTLIDFIKILTGSYRDGNGQPLKKN